MGSITSYSKQIVVFFLALSLFIRPAFASSVGGWSMGNPIAQGASTIYEGSKNVIINGADYVKKGTAIVTPTATGVAKVLAKGVAGVALSVAVEQLLGAVDWVLDPANNQIRYKDPDASNSCTATNGCGAVDYYLFRRTPTVVTYSTSPDVTCRAVASSFGQTLVKVDKYYDSKGRVNGAMCRTKTTGGSSDSWGLDTVINPVYDPNATDENREKTMPLEVVAAKVISNAEGNTDKKSGAQVATGAAAADIVQDAQSDQTGVKARPIAQQLEATSTTKPADADAAATANTATGTQTQNPTKPEVKDIALEFPAFCAWAPTLCEFAQTANQAIADAKAEYADKPQENKDTELEIPDPEEPTIDSDISFGGSCPAPLTSQVNFMGINETIEFSFDNVCEIAQFIKPVVISVSAFSAALIVAGIRTEDD